MVIRGYKRLQEVTGGYNELQGSYRRLRKITKGL